MKLKILFLTVSILVLSFSVIHFDKKQSKLLNFEGSMWHGGKPSLPIRVSRFGHQLRIEALSDCEQIEVRLHGVDNVSILSQKNWSFNCSEKNSITIPFQTAIPEFDGYLVAEISMLESGNVSSMTKSFLIRGAKQVTHKPKPTSVDQNGVRYHEFIAKNPRQ